MLFCIIRNWPIVFLKVVPSIKQDGWVSNNWQIEGKSGKKEKNNNLDIALALQTMHVSLDNN